MHIDSKFVCPGMCLQLSTLAQTGLMFAMIALSVDKGKHSNQTITSPWPHFTQIVCISVESKVLSNVCMYIESCHLVPDSACQ